MGRKNVLMLAAGVLIGMGAGLALLLILTADGGLLKRLGVGRPESSAILFPAVDAAAQDFTLDSIAGDPVRLSEQRGKTVILNFWATWCEPCKLEMPLFQQYAGQYPDTLQVLAVNYDEQPEAVRAYMQELGLTLTVLLDPGGKVVKLYQVRGFPTTFLIDPEGVVRYQHIGYLDEAHLKGYLDKVGFSP